MRRTTAFCVLLASICTGLVFGTVLNFDFSHTTPLRISVSGAPGAPLSVQAAGSAFPNAGEVRILTRGTGRLIAERGQLRYRAQAFIYQKGYKPIDRNSEIVFSGSARKKELKDLAPAVLGMREGSRVALLKRTDSAARLEIVIVDILPTVLRGPRIRPPAGTNLPEITPGKDGIPVSVSGPQQGPYSALTVYQAVKGSGVQVKPHDTVTANYLLVNSAGKVLENTWKKAAPAKFKISQALEGLREAVTDQRCGSRIAVGIPAAEAQGKNDLTVVIDILGTESETGRQTGDGKE